MNKISLLLAASLLGVLTLIVFSNQEKKSQRIAPTTLSSSDNISPTISVNETTPVLTQAVIQPSVADNVTKATTATIKTIKGNITISLYPQDAPNTVTNFVKKSKSNYYKDLTFHRVEDWVIQGGDPMKNGTGGGNMPTELNDKQFVVGAVGVARRQDIKISNDSQFFITKKDSQFLNGLYTNFGIVTEGMNVVEKIEIGDKIIEISIQ